MKAWMLSELKDVLQCEIPVEAEITCVSTDTRNLPQGCLFVALRGSGSTATTLCRRQLLPEPWLP